MPSWVFISDENVGGPEGCLDCCAGAARQITKVATAAAKNLAAVLILDSPFRTELSMPIVPLFLLQRNQRAQTRLAQENAQPNQNSENYREKHDEHRHTEMDVGKRGAAQIAGQ